MGTGVATSAPHESGMGSRAPFSPLMHHSAALPPAGFLVRLASMLYDSILLFGVLWLASAIASPLHPEAGWRRALFQAFLVAVIFGYYALFWVRGGQTLAMKTWRIRITSAAGQPVSLGRALARFALALPSIGCLGVGLVWALFDKDKQFLHDRLSGTRLVRIV